jgi:hypothetical protein
VTRKHEREAARAQVAMLEPLLDVFVTTGIRTSDGPGPGHKRLPRAEASALIRDRRAVHGSQPPRGFGDRQDSGVR